MPVRPWPTITIGGVTSAVGDSGVPAPVVGDAQAVHQVLHELARGDLRAELVERGLGLEGVGESFEAFLPRVLAEVVESGRRTRLIDQLPGWEQGTRHGRDAAIEPTRPRSWHTHVP